MNATWMRPWPSRRRHRAEGEMTSHERFEPDTNRLNETARRLHLMYDDRQVINASASSVDLAAVEEVLNRHPAWPERP